MNSMEEKLWDYIDGSCTEDEHKAITMLIEQDEVYRKKYKELLNMDQDFNLMELDEPSMAFTYKVIESIRAEHAQQPLKAAIDKHIILGISAFFIITIAALLIYVLGNVNWSSGSYVKVPEQLNTNHINNFLTGPIIKGFLFFDVVLGLFFLDNFLRRQNVAKQP
jgi:hypothetical protein